MGQQTPDAPDRYSDRHAAGGPNEQYVPLNDGNNWKGDPNATTTGQDIPQLPPGAPSAFAMPTALPPAALGVAEYDPATGQYTAANGRVYSQSELAPSGSVDKSWQSMMLPPNGN